MLCRNKNDDYVLLTLFIRSEDNIWGEDIALRSILRELKAIVLLGDDEGEYEIDGDEDSFFISIRLPLDDVNLYEAVPCFLEDAKAKLTLAEEKIKGFTWKNRYSNDEEYFTKSLLIPLFRKMGYSHVRFNHGHREFGKDILLSEATKLCNLRHISAQVKAGDVSGKAGTQIDTIISQIQDSFDLPVEGPGVSNQFRISEVYFIISGKYSDNAKTKINAKLPRIISASIYFLDREDIEWLVQKNWPIY